MNLNSDTSSNLFCVEIALNEVGFKDGTTGGIGGDRDYQANDVLGEVWQVHGEYGFLARVEGPLRPTSKTPRDPFSLVGGQQPVCEQGVRRFNVPTAVQQIRTRDLYGDFKINIQGEGFYPWHQAEQVAVLA